MFVGDSRRAEVRRLADLFNEVRRAREPAMVVYLAPPGWGKTRIVQEFYGWLAGQQDANPYWPASLLSNPTDGNGNILQIGYDRKAVRPREVAVSPQASIPWLWLAPTCSRLGDGSPAPILDTLSKQITRHLPHLIGQLERRKLLSEALHKAIVAALPLPDILDLAGTVVEIGDDLVKAWQAGRSGRTGTRSINDLDDVERAVGLGQLLTTLLQMDSQPQLSAVLVLDDAHDLDPAGAAFVEEMLSTDLPIFIIATTWPDRLTGPAPAGPFASLVAAGKGADRITRVDLQELRTDDLIEYVLGAFPATDPQVAALLAEKADKNPYSLRLLLNLPRVAGTVYDGRIGLAPSEIPQIRGGLADLLGEHWNRLPVGVQQILVAASLLGESVLDDVLQAGLARLTLTVGLEDAFASAWLRPAGTDSRTIEFVERLRYEIALERVPNVLPAQTRGEVMAEALRSVRHQLRDHTHPQGRRLLLALHVALARAGVETDLFAAARSAAELAERARAEARHFDAISYLNEAIGWFDHAAVPAWSDLVRCLISLSDAQRAEYQRDTGEAPAVRALELSDAHLPTDDELRIVARLTLARCRSRRHDQTAYEAAGDLIAEAERIAAQRPDVSAEVSWELLDARASRLALDGDRVAAAALYRQVAAMCEAELGPTHRRTLAALENWAYSELRAWNGEQAIQIRRTVLARRIEMSGTAGSLQTAAVRNNLAFSLIDFGGDKGLEEAEQLVADAYQIWSRMYGVDGKRTRRARLLRTRIWCLHGLAAERAGDEDRADVLFRQAETEAAAVVALRQKAPPGSVALALQRRGAALACLRDPEAIRVLSDALRLREDRLHQTEHHWEVMTCARVLCWAYERIGLMLEADGVRRKYPIRDDDPRPVV